MSRDCIHVPKAILRIRRDIRREKIECAQAVRHDELIAVLKLCDDALNVDVRSLLGKITAIRVCDLLHSGLGLYWNSCSSNRGCSSSLEGHISLFHMPTLRDFRVKVNSGRYEVDMGLNIFGDRVVIAGDVGFAGDMLVQEEFCLQQILRFRHGSIEGQPSHGLRFGNSLRINARAL